MSEPRVRVGTGSASYSVDEIPEIVTIMGLDGRVEHVNASGGRILGRDPAEIAARWAEFVHPDDLATVRGEVAALLSMPGLRRTFTLRMAHPDGSWLHLETVARNLFDDPQIGAVVLHSRDVSVGHEATGRLAHERLHDHLTGLPTRGVFVEHLERALRRAARMRSTVAVFGLDLDGLSRVNQQHGYDRGDTLLVRVGHDLDAVLRADDVVGRADAVVARFEDSFFVLYEDVADVAAAAVIAARLVAAVPEAVVPGVNGEVTATATVGVVLSGGDRADAESLLVDATAAMHVGKANGGDRVEFFDIEVRHEADRRMADVAELRTALHEGQLHLHYQPLVDVRSGAIRAVEALARWQHPERGAVSPGEFIPLAESAGLIGPLGHWALVEACRQRARWNPFVADPGDLVVSVNVSSHQFDPSLPDVVAEVLDDSGAAPESLCIEITESSVITDVESAIATMRRLQEMGVRVSIDDFGSGYSSLAQLKRLPFDELKIDQSFVELLGRGHTDSAIVSAIVTMARALRLTVVAEGVETTTQLAELERLGCDIAQGFLFARPMSPADVAALLEAGRPLHPRP